MHRGQEYILNTIDMVKDKYTKNAICFPTWKKTEEEYIEALSYCTQNNLICIDFYRRNKDWKKKMEKITGASNGTAQNGGIENVKAD